MEDFRFEFCRSASMANTMSLADDIFHQGRLLPVSLQKSRSTGSTSSKYLHRESNSLSQKLPLLNVKVRASTTDPLDTESSHWQSFRSKYPYSIQRSFSDSSSDKIFRRTNPATASIKSKSKPQSTSFAPAKASCSSSKTSLKWLQFFTPGLMKAPTMNLQDIRQRQRKLNNKIGARKSVLKRPVPCTYDLVPELQKRGDHRALKFQEGFNSVYVKETQGSKRWRICDSLSSVKDFSYPIKNCSSTMQKKMKKKYQKAAAFL
ncbi:hypothetical protein SUGI_0903400 [Cryptomeria japonica]|nr:hypothetical protein SUGI_0903400 [Cryptomeria japonica]